MYPGAVLVWSDVGRGPWGAGFEGLRDEARRASAAAPSAMKVVAAALVTVGGRHAGRCCFRAWDGWGGMSLWWLWLWRLWCRRRRRGLWRTAGGPGQHGRASDAGSCE